MGELALPLLPEWLAEGLRRRHRERLVMALDQPLPKPEGLPR